MFGLPKFILISTLFISIVQFSGCFNPNKPIEVDFSGELYSPAENVKEDSAMYVAISSMISPKETFNYYVKLLNRISERLGKKILLKQRKTYQEVNKMLLNNEVDFAFICSGAYADDRSNLEIIAVPVTAGKPFYQSYIIVNRNFGIKSFSELKGRSFAFTDPLSNSGKLYAVKRLHDLGETPESFFEKFQYTYAHDYSIQLVSKGLVDGASVDGLIVEYLKKKVSEKVKDVEVIEKSMDFGIPPIVSSKDMPAKTRNEIKEVFLNLHNEEDMKPVLEELLIEKFVEGRESNYDEIENMNVYISK